MVSITLPDGSIREYDGAVCGADVAAFARLAAAVDEDGPPVRCADAVTGARVLGVFCRASTFDAAGTHTDGEGAGATKRVAVCLVNTANRTVQVVKSHLQAVDHPAPVSFPEGRYLKCLYAIVS